MTLENVVGGVGVVYEITDVDESTEIHRYLPVGETVEVPVGTKLHLEATSVNCDLDYLKVQNGDSEEAYKRGRVYTVKPGETVISPVYVEEEDSIERVFLDVEPFQIEAEEPVIYEGQLIRVKTDKNGNVEEELPVVNARLSEETYNENDNDLFTLTSDGKLTSRGPLSIGDYWVDVISEYEGEEISEHVGVTIGSSVHFTLYTGHSAEEQAWYTYFIYNTLVWSDSEFKDVQVDSDGYSVIPAMFGGYEFAGWYDSDDREDKVEDTRKIGDLKTVESEGQVYVFARFEKDGKFYDPEIKSFGGSENPGGGNDNDNGDDHNPSIPNRPSGGRGGSGGSSSGSSYSGSNLYGEWQQDASGWRFRQTDGTYAVNKWGKVDGTWYYFGADSHMVTGWFFDGTNWYYLNPVSDGTREAMKTGWIYDDSYGRWFYLSASGEMMTGWQLINGAYYYLNPISDGSRGAWRQSSGLAITM